MEMTTVDPLDALRDEHPGWKVRRVGDTFVATRLHDRAGASATLIAGSVEGLRREFARDAEDFLALGKRPYDPSKDDIFYE